MKNRELARLANCTTGTIRFYERKGCYRSRRTEANYRSYNEGHIDRLRFIGTVSRVGHDASTRFVRCSRPPTVRHRLRCSECAS